jgi:hypothetical protein
MVPQPTKGPCLCRLLISISVRAMQPKGCKKHGPHGLSPRPGANKTEVPTGKRSNCKRHRVNIRLRTSVDPPSTHPSDPRRTDSNRLDNAQQVPCNGTVLLLIMNSAWSRNQGKGLAAADRNRHRESIRLRFVDACIRPASEELTPIGLTTVNKCVAMELCFSLS